MSLLQICQDVADEVGVGRPSSIIGSSGVTERKLLRAANKAGRKLAKQVDWRALRTERTFSAVAGSEQTGAFTGVTDFDRFVRESHWDRTNRYMLSGPISAAEWQALVAHNYDNVGYKFTHRGDSIFVTPDADGDETFAFEYISKNWATNSAGGDPDTRFMLDADVSLIDEELITTAALFYYKNAEGLVSVAEYKEFQHWLDLVEENDTPTADVLVTADIFEGRRHWTGEPQSSNRARIY